MICDSNVLPFQVSAPPPESTASALARTKSMATTNHVTGVTCTSRVATNLSGPAACPGIFCHFQLSDLAGLG